jgi:hypothetical protein
MKKYREIKKMFSLPAKSPSIIHLYERGKKGDFKGGSMRIHKKIVKKMFSPPAIILIVLLVMYGTSNLGAQGVHSFRKALPDTGQTSCYDSSGSTITCSGAGQDGSYIFLNPQLSYIDNGDGTVTDKYTGLMWKKCSEPDTTADCSGMPNVYTWADAISQCENLTYAGYSDWRLPNMKELFSLIKYEGSSGPYIDTTYFPNTVNSYYWTSTTFAPTPTSAMAVSFSVGFVSGNLKAAGNMYVRCVRAGP